MDACYVANSQQCVPVSMTGRIFDRNMTTFNKAGITEVPKSLDDLMAAGKAFQEKLGDDYYPMHLGAYDRYRPRWCSTSSRSTARTGQIPLPPP